MRIRSGNRNVCARSSGVRALQCSDNAWSPQASGAGERLGAHTDHSTVCQFSIVTRTALYSVRTSSRMLVIKRPTGPNLLEHCRSDATIRTFHLQETERGSRDDQPGALAFVLRDCFRPARLLSSCETAFVLRDLSPASALACFDFNALLRDVGLSVQAEGGAKRGRGAACRARVGPAVGRVHASAWG